MRLQLVDELVFEGRGASALHEWHAQGGQELLRSLIIGECEAAEQLRERGATIDREDGEGDPRGTPCSRSSPRLPHWVGNE